MNDRLAGLLLFLPVPVVLGLFTRQPLGAWLSLGTGLLLVATHRLYARPFALRRAGRRCLWCGGAAGEGPTLLVDEPFGRTEWRCCSVRHLWPARRTLAWTAARRRFVAGGILGSLGAFIVLSVGVASGAAPWSMADAIAVFRAGVAATVLPLGWLAPSSRQPVENPPRLPFPVHIQALVGTLWVVWLFRLVGTWWLAASLVHFAGRLAYPAPLPQ